MSNQSSNQKTEAGKSPVLAGAMRSQFKGRVLVVNAQGRILSYTPAAGQCLRLSPSPTCDKPEKRLPEALLKIVRRAAATGKTFTTPSIKLPPDDRNAATLHATALPLPAKSRRREIVVVLDETVTASHAEQNLARLDRLAGLGTLSASMAHEIKNALVAVKTFTDLLLEKNRDAELADVVGREMRRIDAMVRQMLKYAGPGQPAFAAVRVHDVLDHSLRLVQPRIEERLISLDRAFRAVPDAILGDDHQLQQVFVNLLLNAIEAMGSTGLLTVSTDLVPDPLIHPRAASVSGTQVRVAIADTGVGIAKENMKRLFEPFFTTKQNGTGLGLAIARRIVQEHCGDITAQSEVNKGTTFSVLLPVHADAR